MKRALSILLSALFLLIALPLGMASVGAAITDTYGDLTYEIENGAVSITDCNTSVSGELIIPDVIEDQPVTTIKSWAFRDCTSLISITIPDSVTTIEESAFYSCSNLTSITLPFVGEKANGTGATHFGYIFGAYSYSFNNVIVPCSLKTVIITGGSSIGERAFYGCNNLTLVSIPASVTTFGKYAFYNCDGLSSITIPQSVTTIGNNVFYGCDGLTSIIIPDSVTTIGSSAFYGCNNMVTVNISVSVANIGAWAFEYCPSLTDVYYGGTETDRANMSIGESNGYLLNAIWHYHTHIYDDAFDLTCNECGVVREMVSPIVFSGNSTHENVSGLAFRFDVAVQGMEKNVFTAIYDNAMVNGYKLLSMGATVTNGFEAKDISAVYLLDCDSITASFAVRVINIPINGYDVDVTATPYIILEIDGVATTIYGEAQTCSYNDVKN